MKKIVIIIVIILLVGGYLGRNRIKSMLGMSQVSSSSQTTQSTPPTSSAMAPSNNIYLTKTDPSKGQYLTDFQGTTLYTYDKDTKGVSNCTGECATAWPVYTSGATAEKMLPTNISVITRTDGSKQFAWKGMPLYYYAGDKKPGDITGDGVGGVWHIVKP
jgi:predicted lipoprotein with Yx(FWY)xxD motif